MLETNPSIYPRFINPDNPSGKRRGKPFGGIPLISPADLKEERKRLREEAKARGGKPILYCPNGDPNVDQTGVRISMGDPAIKTVPWTNFQFPVVTEDTIARLSLLKQQLSGKPHPRPPAEECPQPSPSPSPSPPKEKRLRQSSFLVREVKLSYPPSFYLLSHEERIPIMKAKLAEAAAKARAKPTPPKPPRIWNGMSSQERQEAEAELAAGFYKACIWNGMSSSQEPEKAELAAAEAGIQAQIEGGVSVLERPLEHLNLAAADSSGVSN